MREVFERITRSTRGARGTLATAAVLAAVGVAGISTAEDTEGRQFTEKDVELILAELREVDPATYHIRLPMFYDGRVTDTKTYGALPITEVQRIAKALNVELNETGNILTVLDSYNDGDKGGGGGSQPTGPGSHINADSGTDLSSRIEVLLKEIDQNEYQFLR